MRIVKVDIIDNAITIPVKIPEDVIEIEIASQTMTMTLTLTLTLTLTIDSSMNIIAVYSIIIKIIVHVVIMMAQSN